ncbi:MAG: dihydropteroate synthase [Nitrospirae bacterium]|nr:MAG: dihydropteroate synthase [Nitrospirota bacterium]
MDHSATPVRWRAREYTLPVQERVLIMGVLNVTPDSFSDGGRYLSVEAAVARAEQIEAEGADLLDLGGESSRPGSQPVPLDVELARVLPVLTALAGRIRIPISVDTTKAEVARRALDAGAAIINDVSALRNDPDMADVVAKAQAGLILMHMQGIPATMQDHPAYAAVVEEVYDFLRSRLEAAVADGIEVERIAVDPGFGFGKTLDHNVALLGGLPALRGLDRPIVIGPSRKSFVGAMLRRPVEEREWGTAAAVAVGVFQGAHVVRVHSVRQMKDVAGVAQSLRDQMPVNRYSLNVKREALEGDDRCISSLHD